MMTDEQFMQFVSDAMTTIPEKFLARMENVAVTIADEPTREQLHRNNVRDGGTLLGLYEGVPLTKRGEEYGGGILPDKITIFKIPTLEEAVDIDCGAIREHTVARIVRDTVWHEIAHYFGWGDDAIELREQNGTNCSH